MMVSSTPIVPVFRAMTIAGIVLDRDEQGEVYHSVVQNTTCLEVHEVLYTIK